VLRGSGARSRVFDQWCSSRQMASTDSVCALLTDWIYSQVGRGNELFVLAAPVTKVGLQG